MPAAMAYTVAGVLLLVGLLVDVVATTVASGRPGGWVSRRTGRAMWTAIRRAARGHQGVMEIGGLVVVVGLLVQWLVIALAAWWLVLLGTGEVVEATTGRAASAMEALYYAGVTFSTLGNGEYLATSAGGRVVTVVASVSGIVLLTLCITYLVPVISAVSLKRRVAAQITDLGPTPHDVARRLLSESGTSQQVDVALELSTHIRTLTQQHYSYPVLHYFHSRHRKTALAVALGVLDDALVLVELAQRRDEPPIHLHLLDTAIEGFLDALAHSFIEPADEPPPQPTVEDLRRLIGSDPLPTTTDIDGRYGPRRERRRRLKGFVHDDGWSWDDVARPETTPV